MGSKVTGVVSSDDFSPDTGKTTKYQFTDILRS